MKIESYIDAVDGKEYVRVTVDEAYFDERTAQYIVEVLTHYPNVGTLTFERVVEFNPGTLVNILRALQTYLAHIPTGNHKFTLRFFVSKLGKDDVIAIAELLRAEKSIFRLDLFDNKIDNEGSLVIFEALIINHTLTHLECTFNNIDDKGALPLAEALKAGLPLAYLDLRANNIGGIGIRAIINAIKTNRTLTYLNLGINPSGDEAVQEIEEFLRTNRVVTYFSIIGSDISDGGKNTIFRALINNITILHLEELWYQEQDDIVNLVLRRNKMLVLLVPKIREILQKVDRCMLAGLHFRVGAESPLNMLDGNVLSRIMVHYRNELDFVVNATEAQFGLFIEEERTLITRIRETQREIIVRTQALLEEEAPAPEANRTEVFEVVPSAAVAEEPLLKRRRYAEEEVYRGDATPK